MVGSCRHAQPHGNPPPSPPAVGGRRGVPPCQGAAPAKVRGATCTCVLTAPRTGWRLLTLQQLGPAPGEIGTASTNLSQSDFVKPVPPPSPGLCHQGGKKQKALGLSRADDTASCDTCPAGSGGGGTRQAARVSWSLSPFHWGPQQRGREAAVDTRALKARMGNQNCIDRVETPSEEKRLLFRRANAKHICLGVG